MNRSALCIRMLQLLKTRGRMKINELAEGLEQIREIYLNFVKNWKQRAM